jgi:predicted aminopeptidase
VAEKRLAESLQRVKERESRESKVAEQDRLREIYESLQSEEAKIRDKNRELEMLRKEVQQLRKEVQKMTKDRSGK